MDIRKLNKLEKKIYSCSSCNEVLGTRMYPMPHYYGSRNIRLMIIGLNPGLPQPGEYDNLKKMNYDYKKHYEQGIKNCNMGKFLIKAFNCWKISWNEVFFTNIVKCATPGYREPLPEEIDNCVDFLMQQLNIVKPKNVLLLGKLVSTLLLEKFVPNNIVIENNIKYMLINHPSYIKRVGLEFEVIRFLSSVELL